GNAPWSHARGGASGDASNGVTHNTPPLSDVASPSEATCTSNRPPGLVCGDSSAVTTTAATLRSRSRSAGISTLNRRSRLVTERTVCTAPTLLPKERSPVRSEEHTSELQSRENLVC